MTKAFRDKLSLLLGRKPAQMQVAALCRSTADGRVLLVTSRGTGRWILPKGWPMPGRTLADAAMQEAWEEAGVHGRVDQAPVGTYTYDKVQDRGFAVPIEVRVYLLEVDSLADDWLEAGERKRRWFRPERAAELVAEAGLKDLLKRMAQADAAPDAPAGGSPA